MKAPIITAAALRAVLARLRLRGFPMPRFRGPGSPATPAPYLRGGFHPVQDLVSKLVPGA